ncbi:MAG: peptidoglycan DD-metalloendopeptidase family protein [Tumebacillaceae bacterium]
MNNNTENKNKQQETGNDKASRGNAPQNNVKRTFAKRWTFPVIYLAASVLIVGLMYAKSKDASPYQIDKPNNNATTHEQVGPKLPDQNATTPTSSTPDFMWPVGEGGQDAAISMAFFHDTDSADLQAKEVVAYQNSFTPHAGVDLGLRTDQPFMVVAAAKGTVTDVELDPLMGNVVEIDHGNGYTTYYASLSDVEVKKGDNVLQGQPIAKSSNNRFEAAEKNHLHFELRKDGQSVDPNTVLSKKPTGDNATTTSGSAIGTPASTDNNGQLPQDSAQHAAKDQAPGAAQDKTQDTKKPAGSSDAKQSDANKSGTDSKDTPSTAPSEEGDNTNDGATDTH